MLKPKLAKLQSFPALYSQDENFGAETLPKYAKH